MFVPIDDGDPLIELAENARGPFTIAPLAFCEESKRIVSLETPLTTVFEGDLSLWECCGCQDLS